MTLQWHQYRTSGDILALWLLLLLLPGATRGSFEVIVWPEAPTVEYGGSLLVNCSTTCVDVSVSGGLETSLTKVPKGNGSRWVAFDLINITEWVPAPKCFFNCSGTHQIKTVNMSIYQTPEQVVLEPLPEKELGQAYNLTCQVLNVAPVRHLTVTLRQGGQTLHTEMFQNDNRTGAASITVTHMITPRRWDYGQEITCNATLDLRPQGLFSSTTTSSPVKLQEAVSPMAIFLAIAMVATLAAMLLGILACGLVQQHRTQREARPEPREATQSWLDLQMAQAGAEHGPAAGDSLDWPEDTSQ